jgi:hypothetical protein
MRIRSLTAGTLLPMRDMVFERMMIEPPVTKAIVGPKLNCTGQSGRRKSSAT